MDPEFILSIASSPLVLLVAFLVVVLDGFFPPVPSETVVVALASIGFATGAPNPWLVLLAAALGSFVGDNIAFTIGRRLGIDRFRFARGPRVAALLDRVRGTLVNRSASTILTARFIPVGRVAVNVLAGSSAFPRRRFVVLSAMSGIGWAAWKFDNCSPDSTCLLKADAPLTGGWTSEYLHGHGLYVRARMQK